MTQTAEQPPDKPISVTARGKTSFDEMIAPCIVMARKTLPAAKTRYLAGLPKDELFYVTVRLSDPDGKFESVFVQVRSWEDEKIRGFIDNEVTLIKSYKKSQTIEVNQADVLDWTFSKADGTEDGNYIGKQIESPKHDVCKEGGTHGP